MSDCGADRLEGEYSRMVARKIVLTVVLAVAVFLLAGYTLTYNTQGLGFTDCYRYLFGHILGNEYEYGTVEWQNDYVIWNLYTPRVVLGLAAGAGLALCGVVMQSLINNPLADPYTTGISDGACLGAVSSIVLGFSLSTVSSSMGVVTSAFFSGLVPAFIIIALSRMVRMTSATTILVGVALSYIFSGLQTVIMVGTDAETLQSAYLWQIGTLSGAMWGDCVVPLVVVPVVAVFMMLMNRNLNLLSLGDDSATSLGLDVDQFRTLCMVVISVCIASIVSFCGIIGFIGLVAPHIVRMVIGGDNKYLIPASMLAGMVFIQVADLISRTVIAPEELRVGVVAALVGAPFFLYVILKRKKNYGEAF